MQHFYHRIQLYSCPATYRLHVGSGKANLGVVENHQKSMPRYRSIKRFLVDGREKNSFISDISKFRTFRHDLGLRKTKRLGQFDLWPDEWLRIMDHLDKVALTVVFVGFSPCTTVISLPQTRVTLEHIGIMFIRVYQLTQLS